MIDTTKLNQDELAIYEKLIRKFPTTISESDYSIFVALLAILTAQVNYKLSEIYRQLDVKTADEFYLRLLGDLIGYTWIESLSVEANRARIMSYDRIRKYRGTLDSIKNLARSSINEESFYSNSENKNIKVYEGYESPYIPVYDEWVALKTYYVGDKVVFFDSQKQILKRYECVVEHISSSSFIDDFNDIYWQEIKFGHYITLELPDSFEIQRLDIEEVRPAGTLIQFVYKVLLEIDSDNISLAKNLEKYTIKINSSKFIFESVSGDNATHWTDEIKPFAIDNQYYVGNIVNYNDTLYKCVVQHFPTTFLDDLASEYWVETSQVFPTWGYNTLLTNIWSRPVVLRSLYPGVTKIGNNKYNIETTKSKTVIIKFNYLYANTDWISVELDKKSPLPSEGLYKITAEDGELVKYELIEI